MVRDLCGHGVGCKFHEEPEVLHYGHRGTGIAARKGALTLDNATVTGTTQALQSNYSNDCVMVIQNGSALSSTGDHVITMKNGTLTVKDGTFTGGAKGTIGYSQLSTNTVTVDLSALSDPTGITIYNTHQSFHAVRGERV